MTDEAAALCANAVAGVDLDYEAIGEKSGMLMVSAGGTRGVLFGRAAGLWHSWKRQMGMARESE